VRIGSDNALRVAMGAAAPAAVANLRPERVAADFDAILQQLQRARRPDARTATA
jgi:hypothetical protein